MDLTSLNSFISSNKDKGPYFLLLLRPNDSGDSIIVQAASKISDNLSAEEVFTNLDNGPLTKAIETYIQSSTLNTIYNAPVSSGSSLNPSSLTVSGDTIDDVVKKLTNAGISTVGNLKTRNVIPLMSNEVAPVDDAVTIDDLLKNENNTYSAKNISLIQSMSLSAGGSSRSRKHRRRHKQKKNKNTKRRNRK
jgi:hypothetical protein